MKSRPSSSKATSAYRRALLIRNGINSGEKTSNEKKQNFSHHHMYIRNVFPEGKKIFQLFTFFPSLYIKQTNKITIFLYIT